MLNTKFIIQYYSSTLHHLQKKKNMKQTILPADYAVSQQTATYNEAPEDKAFPLTFLIKRLV